MAFTAGIQTYKSSNKSGGFSEQRAIDRLITVKGYDLEKSMLIGELENGKMCEVVVDPNEIVKTTASIEKRKTDVEAASWLGHKIDEKMKKSFPEGSRVVLVRSKVIANDKVRNIQSIETSRIGGGGGPEKDKVFTGIFTVASRSKAGKERITQVQHWEKTAVAISDAKGLAMWADKMTQASENYGKKIGDVQITEPSVGVMFRAITKTDQLYQYAKTEEEKFITEVIDTSVPFDWIPAEKDQAGNIEKAGHYLTGDEMLSLAERYAEYIETDPAFTESGKDIEIEACFFHSYPASENNDMTIKTGIEARDERAHYNPLYNMAHAQSFVDMAQTEMIVGKNAAVIGILKVSPNKLKKVDGKATEIPSYWAARLFANNIRGHVMAFVRTSTGAKTQPAKPLAIIRDDVGGGSVATATQYGSHSPQHEQSGVELEDPNKDPFDDIAF